MASWPLDSEARLSSSFQVEHFTEEPKQMAELRRNVSGDLDREQGSGLLSERPKENNDIPFCGCLSVRYYQPYFDVDTSDVTARLSSSILYCRSEQNFLASTRERPDAYGPFWISTTLVFLLAVASHLNGWLSSWMKGAQWQYDFQSVLTASSLVYGFAVCVPLVIWFVFKQYDAGLQFVAVLCLYGYSLTVFLPAVLLCLFPSELLCWLSLFAACLTSTVFLLRSLAPMVVEQAKKQAAVMLGAVGCAQLVFVLCMKFYFFYEK